MPRGHLDLPGMHDLGHGWEARDGAGAGQGLQELTHERSTERLRTPGFLSQFPLVSERGPS